MWMLHPLPVGADNSALHPLRFKCGHLWLKKKWIWLLNHYEASNRAHNPVSGIVEAMPIFYIQGLFLLPV